MGPDHDAFKPERNRYDIPDQELIELLAARFLRKFAPEDDPPLALQRRLLVPGLERAENYSKIFAMLVDPVEAKNYINGLLNQSLEWGVEPSVCEAVLGEIGLERLLRKALIKILEPNSWQTAFPNRNEIDARNNREKANFLRAYLDTFFAQGGGSEFFPKLFRASKELSFYEQVEHGKIRFTVEGTALGLKVTLRCSNMQIDNLAQQESFETSKNVTYELPLFERNSANELWDIAKKNPGVVEDWLLGKLIARITAQLLSFSKKMDEKIRSQDSACNEGLVIFNALAKRFQLAVYGKIQELLDNSPHGLYIEKPHTKVWYQVLKGSGGIEGWLNVQIRPAVNDITGQNPVTTEILRVDLNWLEKSLQNTQLINFGSFTYSVKGQPNFFDPNTFKSEGTITERLLCWPDKLAIVPALVAIYKSGERFPNNKKLNELVTTIVDQAESLNDLLEAVEHLYRYLDTYLGVKNPATGLVTESRLLLEEIDLPMLLGRYPAQL